MSRLRVPFRSKPVPNQPNGSTPPALKEPLPVELPIQEPPTIVVEKGKEKEVERLWGLENFGNTCYCNSVLQALYACEPFREFVESYPEPPAPVSPLGPPPGSETHKAVTPGATPGSPLANRTSNPFDNPALTNGTPTGDKSKRGLFSRRPTSSSSVTPTISQIPKDTTPVVPILTTASDIHPVAPNPNGQPPSVFETIQTLFHHLSHCLPHQPLPARKDVKANAENAQTASLLPVDGGEGPQPSLTASSTPNAPPPGPPLLASLPPPSAPRGGGPFQAGTLGRGVVRPDDLLRTVKRENEMFRGMSQQDAHEFLGWVLNKVAEEIDVVDRSLREVGKEVSRHGKNFVQNLFEGVLTNETRCLSCETTSSRDELFLDLSIDIEQHTSVTACLRQFSASEMLCQKNKFYCDSCCGLQEAEKRMKIKRLPQVLALHLKRFKYQENLGRYTKLFYRVPFPTQLRLPNTSDELENPDRLYELFAVVVHIGNGPHHGHYVCLIRSGGRWVMCDDENVEPIDDADIFRYFGDYPSGAGYVLFYQAVDLDLESLGLKKKAQPQPATPPSKAAPPAQAAPENTHVENLMDSIVEDHEDQPSPVIHAVSPKSPLTVDVPSAVTSIPSPPATSTTRPYLNGSRSPSADRRTSYGKPPPPPPQVKDDKWYQRGVTNNDKPDSTTFGGLGVSVPSSSHGAGAEGVMGVSVPSTSQATRTDSSADASPAFMSSSMISNSSGSNSLAQSTASIPPTALASSPSHQASSLGRHASKSAKDRNVSSSSQSSSSAFGTSSDKYSGGGGLSRRLSGMSVSKIGRSGSMSFGKLGFGKKDKKEAVEEEKNVKKGLLG